MNSQNIIIVLESVCAVLLILQEGVYVTLKAPVVTLCTVMWEKFKSDKVHFETVILNQ